MKTLHSTFLLLLLAFSFQVSAQSGKYSISGIIKDKESKTAIPFVNIRIRNSEIGTVSDLNGQFNLTVKSTRNELVISCVGYEKEALFLDTIPKPGFEIYLKPKIAQLKEVTISANPIEAIADSKRTTVLDYDFIGNKILIASFKTKITEATLSLISDSRDTIAQLDISGIPQRFYRDCLGNLHLICNDSTYQINWTGEELEFLYPNRISDFLTIMEPCVAHDSQHLYMSKKSGSRVLNMELFRFKTNNHAIDFIQLNRKTKKAKPFFNSVDRDIALMASKEDWRMHFLATHGNLEMGSYRNEVDMESSRIYTEKIIFKEIFAPLFNLGDSLYLLNTPDSSLLCFADGGKLIRKVPVSFANTITWQRNIILDRANHYLFTGFEKAGTVKIRKIDLNSGNLVNETIIPVGFAENVKANNGFLYYLFRNPDGRDVFLSRIKVN